MEAQSYDPIVQRLTGNVLSALRKSGEAHGDDFASGICGLELVRIGYGDKIVLSKADPLYETYVLGRNVNNEHILHAPHLVWVSAESGDGVSNDNGEEGLVSPLLDFRGVT